MPRSEKLKELEAKVAAARRAHDAARRDLVDQQTLDCHEALGMVIELEIGIHDCKESAIGLCVYDYDNDHACDSCLFCKQPYDRK
jgi:hypothetical protein